MTEHHAQDNSYIIDIESATETVRLVEQDRLFTRFMGGVFPEKLEVIGVHRVLDLACGPGGWALDVAYHYPEMEVLGVDLSETNIRYAAAGARSQGRDNVAFEHADITKPLPYKDGSFDLINGRFLVGFMYPEHWPELLAECQRLLKPGGRICLTEAEWGLTNSAAFEQYSLLVSQALKRAGQSFSVDGRHLGITPMLGPLLEGAGFWGIQQQAHVIDFSAGHDGQYELCEDARIAFQLMQPFLLKQQVTTQEELDHLYHEVVMDMLRLSFCGILFYVSVWGHIRAEGRSYEDAERAPAEHVGKKVMDFVTKQVTEERESTGEVLKVDWDTPLRARIITATEKIIVPDRIYRRVIEEHIANQGLAYKTWREYMQPAEGA